MIDPFFLPAKPAIIRPAPPRIIKPGEPRFRVPPIDAVLTGLGINSLCGGGGALTGTWSTVASSVCGDGDNGGWQPANYNMRVTIANAQLTFPATTSALRITLKAGAGEGLTLGAAYFDNAAATGDNYDMNGTNGGAPYQLKWNGGSTAIAIGAGTTKISDAIPFTRVAGRGFVLSVNFTDASNDTFAMTNTQTGWQGYYFTGGGGAVATLDVSGGVATGPAVLGITLIEAFG